MTEYETKKSSLIDALIELVKALTAMVITTNEIDKADAARQLKNF